MVLESKPTGARRQDALYMLWSDYGVSLAMGMVFERIGKRIRHIIVIS